MTSTNKVPRKRTVVTNKNSYSNSQGKLLGPADSLSCPKRNNEYFGAKLDL